MNTIPYHLLDVFAEQKLEGNQLAVFDDAQDLDTATMQAIAKETNLAETTFITGKHSDSFNVRIFTTEYEMPFAGHPTIGTAAVIGRQHRINDGMPLILNLKIGPVKVSFDNEIIQFTLQKGIITNHFDADELAALFGLPIEKMGIQPFEVSSTGYPFMMVPFADLATLQSASVEAGKLKAFLKENKIHKSNAADGYTVGLFCYCLEAQNEGNDMHSRMFLLQDNVILEDPATGSAHTAFIYYALENKLFGSSFKMKSEQGFEIGRPSILYIEGSYNEGIPQITLGGKVQFVAEGKWNV